VFGGAAVGGRERRPKERRRLSAALRRESGKRGWERARARTRADQLVLRLYLLQLEGRPRLVAQALRGEGGQQDGATARRRSARRRAGGREAQAGRASAGTGRALSGPHAACCARPDRPPLKRARAGVSAQSGAALAFASLKKWSWIVCFVQAEATMGRYMALPRLLSAARAPKHAPGGGGRGREQPSSLPTGLFRAVFHASFFPELRAAFFVSCASGPRATGVLWRRAEGCLGLAAAAARCATLPTPSFTHLYLRR